MVTPVYSTDRDKVQKNKVQGEMLSERVLPCVSEDSILYTYTPEYHQLLFSSPPNRLALSISPRNQTSKIHMVGIEMLNSMVDF